jgi:hypothetical protein
MATFTGSFYEGNELRLTIDPASNVFRTLPPYSALIQPSGAHWSISVVDAAVLLCSDCSLSDAANVPLLGSHVSMLTLNRYADTIVAPASGSTDDQSAAWDIQGQITHGMDAQQKALTAADFEVVAYPNTSDQRADACPLWPLGYGMFKTLRDALVAARLAPSQAIAARRINASTQLSMLHQAVCDFIGFDAITPTNAFAAAQAFNSFESLGSRRPDQLASLSLYVNSMKWERELSQHVPEAWLKFSRAQILGMEGLPILKIIANAGNTDEVGDAISMLLETFTRAGTVANGNGLRTLDLALEPHKESLLPRNLPADGGEALAQVQLVGGGPALLPPPPAPGAKTRSPIDLAVRLVQSRQAAEQHQPSRGRGHALEGTETSTPIYSGASLNTAIQRNWVVLEQARRAKSEQELLQYVLNSDNPLLLKCTTTMVQGDAVFSKIYSSAERLAEVLANLTFRAASAVAADQGTTNRWIMELCAMFRDMELRKMIAALPTLPRLFEIFRKTRKIFTAKEHQLGFEETLASADHFEQLARFIFAFYRGLGVNHEGSGLEDLRLAREQLAGTLSAGMSTVASRVGHAILQDLTAAHEELGVRVKQRQLLFLENSETPKLVFRSASTSAMLSAAANYTQHQSAMALLGVSPLNNTTMAYSGHLAPGADPPNKKPRRESPGGGGGANGGGGGKGGNSDDNKHWKPHRDLLGSRQDVIKWTEAADGNLLGTTRTGTHAIKKSSLDSLFEANFSPAVQSAAGHPCYRALASNARDLKSFVGALDKSWPDATIDEYVAYFAKGETKNASKQLKYQSFQ